MIYHDTDKYESRLVALANTRLVFNTMKELEDYLDNHAIHSNGIKRCYSTFPKLRGAYRDLCMEVLFITGGFFDLDWLMRHYERAWHFYKQNFGRHKNPEKIARKLLENHYALQSGKKLPAGDYMMAQNIDKDNINIAILVLLLLKSLPGYDSKSGDALDMEAQFEKVINFLVDFTKECGVFDVLPVIKMAREEEHKSRLMLIFHTINVLDTYENFLNPVNIAKANVTLKEKSADLDIVGIWTENDTKAFWQIKETDSTGVFFANKYIVESAHLLTVIRYSLHLLKRDDNELTAYFLHPIAMKHRLAGHPYGDEDNAWYISDYPTTDKPDELSLVRAMQSDHWPYKISLHRVTDPVEIDKYIYKLKSCGTIDPYEKCNYTFYASIYAITNDFVYVADEKEECYYKLPRFTDDEFDSISIDDKVGILEMGGMRYLAIDERLLYIPITSRHFNRYAIVRTTELE